MPPISHCQIYLLCMLADCFPGKSNNCDRFRAYPKLDENPGALFKSQIPLHVYAPGWTSFGMLRILNENWGISSNATTGTKLTSR